jgi:triosephosphate isomerase (TIM)
VKNAQRQVIIAGNWKMNKTSKEAAALTEEILAGIKSISSDAKNLPEIILFPAYTSLAAVGPKLKGTEVKLGAQNMDWRNEGAFTGEISPLMLLDLKATHILIGHSERRQFFGETNATTNLRLKAALAHGLKPILCVGEMIDERENDLTDAVVGRQVGAGLTDIDPAQFSQVTIAYEPVWAIGTGKTCEAKEANRVCGVIRKTVAALYARYSGNGTKFDVADMPILYGGSVKSSNVAEQLKQEHIDGSLVGGASLNVEEFLAIIKAGAERVKNNLAAAAR